MVGLMGSKAHKLFRGLGPIHGELTSGPSGEIKSERGDIWIWRSTRWPYHGSGQHHTFSSEDEPSSSEGRGSNEGRRNGWLYGWPRIVLDASLLFSLPLCNETTISMKSSPFVHHPTFIVEFCVTWHNVAQSLLYYPAPKLNYKRNMKY